MLLMVEAFYFNAYRRFPSGIPFFIYIDGRFLYRANHDEIGLFDHGLNGLGLISRCKILVG